MIIVLFHVLYLFGKFVYQNYRANKEKAINDDSVNTEEKLFRISETDCKTIDSDEPLDYEKKSIKFFPPAYVQRYVAVSDVLNSANYQGKLRKIVDFGCAELDFLVYLKNTPGVEEVLCVDIDRYLLEAYKGKAAPLVSEYLHTRATPLVVEIYEGSVTHNDKKLENTDAVVCIELIEHLYPETLNDLPYNIFGYIKPKLVVITTPNADFNVLFTNFPGIRHYDHKFEWTRKQFQDWAENITLRYPDYIVTFDGICRGPEGTEHLGCCTQMAVFHRINERENYSKGIEGLFKTVATHEYPFRVDNRSDEEKILDEATYYIRHLSYQNCDMEEEVPLNRVLDMLSSFHVSIEILQTILEEANWAVEQRESGPVVLIPPISGFSDYSEMENDAWNGDDYATDEDEWNREPGPPINSSRFMEQESWDNQEWDREPSIVIPLNETIIADNTYLFHEENILVDNELERTKERGNIEGVTENNLRENLGLEPSIDNFKDSCYENVPSYSKKSIELSNSSSARKFEEVKEENSFLDLTTSTQNDAVSSSAQKLNCTLNIPPYMSISRASTSPEPYLLQTVKMDQQLQNSSMCNQSMSNHWMLSSTPEPENTSANTMIDVTDGECKLSPKSDNFNQLPSMSLNEPYKETKDSHNEHFSDSASASTSCNQNQLRSVHRNNQVSKDDFQLQDQLQSNSCLPFTCTALIENRPQFTSSPKIETKANTVGTKRRSLDYKNDSESPSRTQKYRFTSSTNNMSLEDSNKEAPPRSNKDLSISTVSTVNLSTVKNCYNKEDNSTSQSGTETESENRLMNNSHEHTLTSSGTSTIASTIMNEDKQTATELPETNSLNDSCISEKSSTTQTPTIQSLNCDTNIHLIDQQLIIKSESRVQFVYENADGKTELKSEVHNACDLKGVENVNSIETSSCSRAKDISNLESISLVSSLRIKDARDVQSMSVLKSEKQFESVVENREAKCKNVNPHAVEVVENIELKASSPEAMETPPNSWSPEVLDSGYPNSASAQDMTPEYDLSSIAQDHVSDSESPSIAEAPRLGVLEVVEVENGDLANNNRDGEGNNMMAAELNDLEDLQPLIDVLENDLENENDIYVVENGFPMWLLRILNMANPIDVEMQMRDQRNRELRFPNGAAGNNEEYANVERDEGFDSSSEENSDLESNNALMNNVENENENENENASNSGSEHWVAGGT